MDVVGLVILASVVTATAVTPLTITIVADIVLRMLSIAVRVSEMTLPLIWLLLDIAIISGSLRRTFDMATVSFSDFTGTYAGIRPAAKQFLHAENQEIN